MGHDTPQQTREGSLIETAANATGLSVKKLAANAGISDTRWRHIVRGWQPAQGGGQNPVVAPALTLAKMAFTVGVSPDQLTQAGREDAADLLARLGGNGEDGNIPLPVTGQVGVKLPSFRTIAAGDDIDEIDLVVASKTMSTEQKLRTIRQILLLRQQRDEEIAAMLEVPAPDNGAQVEQQS
jgi:hypothetical protein